MAERENIFEKYGTSVRSMLPVRATSQQSLDQLLQRLAGIQSSRIGIEALGGEEPAKVKKGFLQSIFDPREGLLFAPARFTSALVADVAGLAEEEVPELQQYNPLESALRSARGEFAVTGGDIFRTEEDDSVLERVGKLAGAFGYDVVTDPLNYFGGVGVFTRKGAAKLAADPTVQSRLIAHLESEAIARKLAPDTFTNSLAKKSLPFTRGAVRFDDTAKTFVDEAGEALTPEAVKGLAGQALSNVVSESFITKGRGGVIKALTGELGDETLARSVFERLPQDIVGGVFLKNPITGKPITRVAGGRGATNPFIEKANEARFRASTLPGAMGGTRTFSGKLGPTWASVKHGLLSDNAERLAASRTTFMDWVEYERGLRQLNIDARQIANRSHAVISGVRQTLKLMSEQEQQEFTATLGKLLNDRTFAVSDTATPAMLAARDAAAELQADFSILFDELQAAGVPINRQAEFRLPLMYTDEYVEHLAKVDPRQGPETRGRYRGNVKRQAYEAPTPVTADEAEAVGTTVFAPPAEANKVATKPQGFDKIYEEDPVKLLTRYAEWATREIAAGRFVQSLQASGVIARLPQQAIRSVNVHNAAALASAMRTMSKGAAQTAQEELAALRRELADLVHPQTVAARKVERGRELALREAAVNVGKDNVARARAALRAIDAELAATEPNIEYFTKMFKDPNIPTSNEILEGLRRKKIEQRRRIERLKGQQVTLSKRVAEAQAEAERVWSRGGEILVWDPVTKTRQKVRIKPATLDEREAAGTAWQRAEDMADDLSDELQWETQSLREIEEEINDARLLIDNVTGGLAEETVDNLRRHAQLLEEKRILTAEYLGLQNRLREAKESLRILGKDIMLPRGNAIRTAVNTYVQAKQEYLLFRRSIGSVAIKDLSPALKERHDTLKAALGEATKTLYETTGYVRKVKGGIDSPGRRYAQQIVKLANDLSVAEIEAAQVLADRQRLGDFMEKIVDDTSSHQVKMEAVGGMYRAYRSIRRKVSAEDIELLSDLERAVYENYVTPGINKLAVRERRMGRVTAKLDVLQDDLAAARKRNDTAEVDRLEAEIFRLNQLTDEEGMQLVGAGRERPPRYLQDVYAPQGVREAMERLYHIENNPNDWERFIGRMYDPLALVWRTAATVGRGPGFTLNNVVGGLFNNWLGGVTFKSHAQASKILWAFRSAVQEAAAENPGALPSVVTDKAVAKVQAKLAGLKIGDVEAERVFADFMESGTYFTTELSVTVDELRRAGLLPDAAEVTSRNPGVNFQFDEPARTAGEARFRNVVNFLLTNPVQTKLNDFNQASEMFLRFAAYVEGYKRYGSKWSAQDLATMLHFDYQDLSSAERWVKRIVPFYTWTRNNVPLQMRALFTQNDKLRKVIIANENAKKAFGVDEDESWLDQVLPDYIDVAGGFATRFAFGGNHMAMASRLPMQDIDQMFQVNRVFGIPVLMPRGEQLMGSIGPITTPLEMIAGRSFDTGQTFDTGAEKLQWGLRGLVPYVGTAQRIASAATIPFTAAGVDLSGVPFVRSQEAVSNLFNFLVGTPVALTTLTEKQVSGGAFRLQQAAAAQLAQLAAEAGVDLEWLRKEIRRGRTPQELRAMISAGLGDADRLARERAAEPVKPSQRNYDVLLRSLGRGGFEGGF